MTLMCNSCAEAVYATDDVYGEYYSSSDVTLIITHGTPYYYNGRLWYYLYNGLYYYPFYYDGYVYLRPYTRVYPWGYNFGRFRPNRYDYRYRPGYHYRPGYSNGRRPTLNPGGHVNPGHRPNNPGHTIQPSRPRSYHDNRIVTPGNNGRRPNFNNSGGFSGPRIYSNPPSRPQMNHSGSQPSHSRGGRR